MSSENSQTTDLSVDTDTTSWRQQPGFAEVRRPAYVLKWLWAFIEGWFFSRNYRQLLVGLPFLIIAVGGPLFVWWLKSAPKDGLVERYVAAAEKSVKDDEPERVGLYLERAVSLRPLRHRLRHQLVMHYVRQETPEHIGQHLQQLTTGDGYIPTRLWLIEQASRQDPQFPLTPEQIDVQLHHILKKQPTNVIANWQLSDRLIQKQQYKTAEDHLLRIIDQVPELGLALAKVQVALKRDQEQVLSHLEIADEVFQTHLLADAKDSGSRIRRAEVLLMKQDLSGAIELIHEGRNLSDNQQLKNFDARLLNIQASRKLTGSLLNAQVAAKDLEKAIRLNPDDPSLLRTALSLNRLGVQWSPDQLQPAIDVLKERPELAVADRQLLLAALAMTGQNSDALDLIRKDSQRVLSDRVLEAELLISDGQNDAGQVLMNQLLEETESKETEEACRCRVQVLLMLKDFEEAYELVLQSQERFSELDEAQNAAWRIRFGQANFGLYLQRLRDGDFQDADAAMEMLLDPRQGPVSVLSVAQRLMALMQTRPEYETTVRHKLVQLARSQRSGWQIYSLLGTYDLQRAEQNPDLLDDAELSLEMAYQSRKSDPMILNNLATALVRRGEDLPRARELVEEAISLLSDPVDALSTRAEISVAEERFSEALEDLETAVARRPRSANVRRLLVKVLKAMDKPALAAEHQAVLEELTRAGGSF